MKKIHKKIIRLQARKMTLCVNGTYYLGKSRHDYHRRPTDGSTRDYSKEFDEVIKHNNAWFNSIPEKIMASNEAKRAKLLRTILAYDKGYWPSWAVHHWTSTYDTRQLITKFMGRIPTQHRFQR